MLVNYVPGEECRIAIVSENRLEEFYSERASADLHVGNIYRGKVTNIEPSLQAAFVDFGLDRAGFLHITDLHPRYFPGDRKEEAEAVGQKTPRRDRPPIQQCLRRGQEILVQVLKEGIGTKGPTLTSYLSIPGRFLVMMPYMERHGVSRKIEDPEKRRKMHELLDELNPPENFGFIIRTAGIDRPKTELKRDLAFLLRLWKDMESRLKEGRGPLELYVESDLVTRTLRDVITTDVKRVVIDDRETAVRARQFLRLAMPRTHTRVYHYNHSLPIFDAFGIESQIQTIHDRVVPMPSGGSLIFDSAEALVAIDVNSGKFRDHSDAETTAYKTNLEAVDEIARQLRLRDLGGLVVLDLIDMYQQKHRREVEKRFRDNLKQDRARTKDLRISELGMLELTRQRMRPSLRKSVFRECPTCHGSGHLLSLESVLLSVMRRLGVAASCAPVNRIEVAASAEVLGGLLNRKRHSIAILEERSGKKVTFMVAHEAGPDTVNISCFDERNNPVDASRQSLPKEPPLSDDDEIKTDDVDALFDTLDDEPEEHEAPESRADEPDVESRVPTEAGTDEPVEPVEAEGLGQEPGAPRRRRRRRRRGGRGKALQTTEGVAPQPRSEAAREFPLETDLDESQEAPVEPVSSVLTGYEGASLASPPVLEGDLQPDLLTPSDPTVEGQDGPQDGTPPKRRRRRGGRRHRSRRSRSGGAPPAENQGNNPPQA